MSTALIIATVVGVILAIAFAFVLCQSWLRTEINDGNDDFLAEVARKNADKLKRFADFDRLVEKLRREAAAEKLAAQAKHHDDIAEAVVAKLIERGFKPAP